MLLVKQVLMSGTYITNCCEEMPCAGMSLLPYGIPATLTPSLMVEWDKIRKQSSLSL